MKLTSLIAKECSNYCPSNTTCHPTSRQCQPLRGHDGLPGLRCGFLEKLLLPLKDQKSPQGQEGSRYRAGLQQERQQAAGEYCDMVDVGTLTAPYTVEDGVKRRDTVPPRLPDQISWVLYGFVERVA